MPSNVYIFGALTPLMVAEQRWSSFGLKPGGRFEVPLYGRVPTGAVVRTTTGAGPLTQFPDATSSPVTHVNDSALPVEVMSLVTKSVGLDDNRCGKEDTFEVSATVPMPWTGVELPPITHPLLETCATLVETPLADVESVEEIVSVPVGFSVFKHDELALGPFDDESSPTELTCRGIGTGWADPDETSAVTEHLGSAPLGTIEVPGGRQLDGTPRGVAALASGTEPADRIPVDDVWVGMAPV